MGGYYIYADSQQNGDLKVEDIAEALSKSGIQVTTTEESESRKKRIDLLLLMDKAGLIDVPTKANKRSMKTIKSLGLDDKKKLVAALTECSYGRTNLLREPNVGYATVSEMCWWAVYGDK